MQAVAIICSLLTQIAVREALFFNIPDICSRSQRDSFTCPWTALWYRSGIIWHVDFPSQGSFARLTVRLTFDRGSLGPKRIFGNNALYHPAVFAAVAGSILPIPFWFCGRRYARSIWIMVHSGVMLNSLLATPPASGIHYSSFLLVGFIFREYTMHMFGVSRTDLLCHATRISYPTESNRLVVKGKLRPIRRRMMCSILPQFNYTLSAALDLGTLLSVLFIFLTLGLPGVSLQWWGECLRMESHPRLQDDSFPQRQHSLPENI